MRSALGSKPKCTMRKPVEISSVDRIIAITAIVFFAFFATGSRNAPAPFAIASTPVIEEQPLAKANNSKKQRVPGVSVVVACGKMTGGRPSTKIW